MIQLQAVMSPNAPQAVGPYVQAVAHGGLLYCSGALPIDPETGVLDDASIASEVDRCLANLEAICLSADTTLDRAVRVAVYTTRLDLFSEINAAYGRHFLRWVPARTTLGVAQLPMGARVEIDAIVSLTRAPTLQSTSG